MVFKRKKKMPEVAEKERLVLIFRRMMEEMRSLNIVLSDGKIRARVLDVLDDALIVEVPPETKSEGKVLPKMSVSVSLIHEGKEYFGKLKILGIGRYHGKDAVRFLFPGVLGINDEFGLTTLNLFPRPEVAFTSTTNKFCEGSLVNIGSKGVDIRSRSEESIRELVNENMETDLSFVLGDVVRISVKGQVLYIKNLGEEVFGVEFLNLNSDTERRVNDWIANEQRAKQERDAAFLRKPKKEIDKPKRKGKHQDGDIDTSLRLLDDYQTELHPGEDYILLLCQDQNLIARVGKALKRKYGVLVSKGRFSNVKQIIEHYDPALVLICQDLGQVDGFELCKTLKNHLEKRLRMMVMISKQDDLLPNKIADSMADDCMVVEPFKPLFFFKKIDEMLDLF